MKAIFSKNVIKLASLLEKPLYAVGGLVRNYLIDGSVSEDFDLCAPICVDDLVKVLPQAGLKVVAEYKRTGTVVFTDGKIKYEFTAFRKEKYVGGEHTPFFTQFTEDIIEDAIRRDFKCNAVYYDIKNFCFVDPLNGIEDIKGRILDTVASPEKVFSNDGLRLMRLARFAGELNFKPTQEVLLGAKQYAHNILEISPERIYTELNKILSSDTKYPFSDRTGHYSGLKFLDTTGVLDYIFPSLTMGRGMEQRKDYHLYDVLEHSLKAVLYSPKEVRLCALLHDVGKPLCFIKSGQFYMHGVEGVKIAEEELLRLKADKATIALVKFVVKEHMIDMDCKMSEKKIRVFIVKNHSNLNALMQIKQADYTASAEDKSVAPTVKKWMQIYDKMLKDNTPFDIKDLSITSLDLIEMGYKGKSIGDCLNLLWMEAVKTPSKNTKENLIALANGLKSQILAKSASK